MNITSQIVAFSSAAGFFLQMALALLIVHYFSPVEVGTLIVISQIGFLLASLSLAQAPLRILANQSNSLFKDTKQALIASIKHFFMLSPIAVVVVLVSDLSFVNSLLWVLALAFSLMTWLLAQSISLRLEGSFVKVGVRVLPQFVSLSFVVLSILLKLDGTSLLFAALLGYAVGAAWILPVFLVVRNRQIGNVTSQLDTNLIASHTSKSSDNRSTFLRMAHAMTDTVLATATLVVWQRLYGAQETGWMAAPLRVIGFVPALVHMAWAQVLLAKPHHLGEKSLLVGLGGLICIVLMCSGIAVILNLGLLSEQWMGVLPYLLCLTLWHGSACLVAAHSHLPFQAHKGKNYSILCIGVATTQILILISPILLKIETSPTLHFTYFAVLSSLGYFFIFLKIKNISK